MKPSRILRIGLQLFVLTMLLAPVASAHPGHDHSDIPSVIRHPFAGIEHILVIVALLAVAVGAAGLLIKARRASNSHGHRARTARLR